MPSSKGKAKHLSRKKAIWLDTTGDLVCHVALISTEPYDHNRAYELVSTRRSNKPEAKCKVQCLSDAIKIKRASTFGSHPPRKLYLYRDIERFYSFADHPSLLVFGCTNPEKSKRHYDMFRFDSRRVQEICDFITRAHNHPMCILVDEGDNPLVRYQSSQSSLAGELESEGHHDESHFKEEDIPRDRAESPSSGSPQVREEHELHWLPPTIGPEDNHLHQTIEPSTQFDPIIMEESATVEAGPPQPSTSRTMKSVEQKTLILQQMRDDPMFNRLYEHTEDDDIWAVDMTYIDVHPIHGSQKTTYGGTYLYVAHHKGPEFGHRDRNGTNADSDDDDEEEVNPVELGFTTTYVHC